MDQAEACIRERGWRERGTSSKAISSRVTPSAAHISFSHNQLYSFHTLLHLTAPHCTSLHLTSPHLTSPLTPHPSFSSRLPPLSSYKIWYFCSASWVHRRGRLASGLGGGLLKQMMLNEARVQEVWRWWRGICRMPFLCMVARTAHPALHIDAEVPTRAGWCQWKRVLEWRCYGEIPTAYHYYWPERYEKDANKKYHAKYDKELESKLPVRAELACPCPWALGGMLGALNLRMLEKGDEKDAQTRRRIDMK